MQTAPQAEHEWLQKLVGDWVYEADADMGPGQPRQKMQGRESVRSLGGLWILAEGQSEMPGGGTANTLMTIGYDTIRKAYVGTWIGSMMGYLWHYDGSMDEAGTTLTLASDGPSFSGDGTMDKYRDVIEVRDPDHRILSARVLRDGAWHEFMTAHYRRQR